MDSNYSIYNGDCLAWFKEYKENNIDLTFLDPPFNQNKEYRYFNDNLSENEYWQFMLTALKEIYRLSKPGASIYFMQREKNTQFVLESLKNAGWTFHNLIIWKKKTSAVPCKNKFSKSYQIIAYATKGTKPTTFNKLRISPPLPAHYKYERKNGLYLTDVWDDIRELTSGYFASEEAIRNKDNSRFHKQQTPIALLLRILLSSSKRGDLILDPFAGTGTTLVTAFQLDRKSIGIEIDPKNIACITSRLNHISKGDRINKYLDDYKYTQNLHCLLKETTPVKTEPHQPLFQKTLV
ncbi:modification methylase [Spirochaetota bacterium]|nr:modification methylase [Spirochaetota bacterium]